MSEPIIKLLVAALGETMLMVFFSTLVASLLGLMLGVILHITRPGQILPLPRVQKTLEMLVNAGRSIPFIILLVAIIPFTRFIVGTSIGTVAAIVPLTVAAIPFMARLVEGTLMEIPSGLMDAAQAMGLRPFQMITKILLPEALPGILNSVTITMITLVNYSAMAGAIGGGGLGDIGIRYGYQRFDATVMVVTVLILILLVQFIQSVGHFLVRKVDHR
ncbi:MAG: ABC transporter permease [Verrucomicrobiae bacterium]|nr:ABC transporter permease [Verrucomicrobiae bacterium]